MPTRIHEKHENKTKIFRLREVIFKNAQVPDILKLPDSRAGAMSCLTGIAAQTSIEQSRPVKINELIKL